MRDSSSVFINLFENPVLISASYNDGTFIFTDISDGKLQVGTGTTTSGNGFLTGTSFVGVANIPSSFDGKTITVISQNSLRSTSGLTGVIIPATIEEIHERAFRSNSNLQFVNFSYPSSLKSIGYTAFGYLSIIETFIIPSSVETIESYAFCNCPKLVKFYYCGSSDFRNIEGCFSNSPLVTSIFVTTNYQHSTFSTINTVLSDCPSYISTPTSITSFFKFYPNVPYSIHFHFNSCFSCISFVHLFSVILQYDF